MSCRSLLSQNKGVLGAQVVSLLLVSLLLVSLLLVSCRSLLSQNKGVLGAQVRLYICSFFAISRSLLPSKSEQRRSRCSGMPVLVGFCNLRFFCPDMSLFCLWIGLFCPDMSLFCLRIGLFCLWIGLFCLRTGFSSAFG